MTRACPSFFFRNAHIAQQHGCQNRQRNEWKDSHKAKHDRILGRVTKGLLGHRWEVVDCAETALLLRVVIGRAAHAGGQLASELVVEDGTHHGESNGAAKGYAEVNDRHCARNLVGPYSGHMECVWH